MLKIGRNELCPCKSGKKYKKCHGAIEDKKQILDANIPVDSAIDKWLNVNRIKDCAHPNKTECSKDIIKAHSIQNNRILSKLSENGDVLMVRQAATREKFDFKFKPIGRKVATTFTGFCGHHDKQLFQEIEDIEYVGTNKQKFLFAYRAFSYEYHKKLEAKKNHRSVIEHKPSLLKEETFHSVSLGYDLAESDSQRIKTLLDNAIIEENYGVIETIEFSFQCKPSLAVCSGFNLEYDLKGKVVNNLSDFNASMSMMMLNVIPNDDSTVILMSWLKSDSSLYVNFCDQLTKLSDCELRQCMSNLIPSYCENVVFHPPFIKGWDEALKKEYLSIILRSLIIPFEPNKRNLLKPTKFNLFPE
ncbi:YecA family protein [Paenibacillus sinopodophylli]|uniref:YecA family protein n=1 Tax=Paenibacillus sinopodophylli TaxID=1837342 RepID=UPI00110CADB9|nr:SEC-C domain-containing protein [Paenibacillus sinopodophylli]